MATEGEGGLSGSPSSRMRVQVFGLQRSGTHYLRGVIDLSLPVMTTKGAAGWVHGFPDERRRGGHGRKRQSHTIRQRLHLMGITPVVVRKDLDHWLESIRRKPLDVEDVTGFTWDAPEDTWHAFYEAWSFAITVRYEDFIEDLPAAVDRLAHRLGVVPKGYAEPEIVKYSPDWRPEHKERYL